MLTLEVENAANSLTTRLACRYVWQQLKPLRIHAVDPKSKSISPYLTYEVNK